MEISPFLQKWLPDIVIIEPQELRNYYIEKLKTAINNSDNI